ncbi:LysR family transcriptional regulator [Alicyclobacillus acidiphilus]|uniref:LysR family transcriptional regulator n=1 Tax=Alicyclobacillus acidiphilus TaxID=182455 RepID=UPI000AA99CD0|nr:LysR family transcriptional regulator [Alicyclobacillus acidiphilus]
MEQLYETFLRVVECQSLSRAASQLHTTQPTVTRQIQQLERLLGVFLFERSSRRLIPTEAGRRVYEYATEVAQLEHRLLEDLGMLVDPERGIIRIGSGLSPALYRLPSILAAYASHHPSVQFQVVTGSSKETLHQLNARTVDIAIVTTPPNDSSSFHATALWQDQLVVVAPPRHALAGRDCAAADLVKHPMVVMHRDSGLRRLLHDRFAQIGLSEVIQPVVETDSLEAMSRFVQAGLGVAVIPWSAVQDDVRNERVRVIRLADMELGSRTITVVTRRHGILSAAASRFVDELPEIVAAMGPDTSWPG